MRQFHCINILRHPKVFIQDIDNKKQNVNKCQVGKCLFPSKKERCLYFEWGLNWNKYGIPWMNGNAVD